MKRNVGCVWHECRRAIPNLPGEICVNRKAALNFTVYNYTQPGVGVRICDSRAGHMDGILGVLARFSLHITSIFELDMSE